MRSLDELLNVAEPAWPLVQQWIGEAANRVEVLPASGDAGRELEWAQVTVRSPMGAIVYHTGGLLIDDGWIRVLGSGHPRLPRSLARWNDAQAPRQTSGFLLVADDVIGGFYGINGGGLGPDVKNVYYFAPDTLRWESLDRGYSDFLVFCFRADLDKYYAPYRWPGWRDEIRALGGDQVMGLYPPLWSAEGKEPAKSHRQPVSIAEAFDLHVRELPRRLGP